MAPLWAVVLAALLAGADIGEASTSTPAPPQAGRPAAAPLLAVSVNPKKMAALVGEHFISLTMDPMDLSEHRKLGPGAVRTSAMAKGLAPAFLRLAGPSSDTLNFAASSTAPSSNGTVTEADLLAVATWARSVGWDLVLALNALARDADGNWDDDEAREMLATADHHGVPLALQLGYEAGALDRAGVSGSRLGADLSAARALLAELPRYQDALLLGPDVAATPAASRAARDAAHFLQDEVRAAVSPPDAVVWQPWSEEERDTAGDLDLVREDVNRLLGRAATRRPLWIAESGAPLSRDFSGALEWARRVQLASRVGADVILRQWQTLGEDHQPTPDYWVSLLYRRLCGRVVLDAKLAGDKAAASITAQCTAAAPPTDTLNPRLHGSFTKLGYERGDVTIVAVNPGAADAKLAVKFSSATGVRQAIVHEYVLTAPGHDLGSRSTLLNGHLLAMDNGGVLPGLTPRVRHTDREAALEVPAHSVVFFVFPGAQARACITAPAGSVEAEAALVPLVLNPTAEDVQVQFDVDDLLPMASKSKGKDKLAAVQAKAAAKDNAQKNSHRSEMQSANGRPLAWASVSDLEQLGDPVDSTPRSKRASPSPLHQPALHQPALHQPALHQPRPAATPEDFMERLGKAQAAQAARRKHMLGHGPGHAAQAQDELPDDQPSTIPAAHMYRPDDKEDAPSKPAHRFALKPFKLPKRPPLMPPAPRHGHALPKRPAAPLPRFKPLPKTGAVVASLVDPVRGVSAEDTSVEVEDDKEDHFPTGEVLAEVGESDEDAESADKSTSDGFDYIEDNEEEQAEPGKTEGAAPPAPQQQQQQKQQQELEPTDQYYFAPGEFFSSPQHGASPAGPSKAPSNGEIGEMDMIVPAMEVVLPSTPSPFEPHLEEWEVMPMPERTAQQQQQDRARVEEDMTRLYQSVAEAAQDLQRERPPAEEEQDLNTDMLIELGKKYLREKKMALKHGVEESPASAPSAPSAPSGPADQVEEEYEEEAHQQKLRSKRQAVGRLTLPSGASPRPRPRTPKLAARTGSAEDARRQLPRDLRKDLEQRVNERRERAEKARKESAVIPAAREQPDGLSRTREQLEQQRQQREQQRKQQREPASENLSKAREQLEQQRQQLEQQLEQQRQQREKLEQQREQLEQQIEQQRQQREPPSESLSRAREQREQQRQQRQQQREQAERERLAKAREQLQERQERRPLRGRQERVKRSDRGSDAPCEYLDSFGRRDALAHAGHAWHKVAPAAQRGAPHHHHAILDGTPTARFKYGHTPQRKHVHKNVRHEVVKKTNVVRYLPAEEEEAEEKQQDVRREDLSAEDAPRPAANQLRRRQHQVYRANDNLNTLWAGSPLSPLQHWGSPRPAAEQAPAAEETSYEAAAPSIAEVVPAEDESVTEYAPNEVKTTEIIKTERTYETPAEVEESGYGSEAEDDNLETSSPSYASLEDTTHHHHGHHYHHHAGKYQDAEDQPEDQTEEQEQDVAEQPLIPPEAEGEAGPVPEFPFKPAPGPKSHVMGFAADDYSPGGWYTFSSAADAPSRTPAGYSSSPSARKQAAAVRTRPAKAPQVPRAPPAESYEPVYPARAPAVKTRPAPPPPAPRAPPAESYEPVYQAPAKTRPAPAPQTIRASYSTTSRVSSRPRFQPDTEIEVAPPRGSWPPAPQAPRVEVASWSEAPVPAAETSWSSYPSQGAAAPVPAPVMTAQPQYQPPPRPQYQPQLSVAVEEVPQYRPAPQQSYPAAAPAPARRQPARQRQQQEGQVPEALAYLAKFFQPVEPVQPRTRPVKKQSVPAEDPWAQPAPTAAPTTDIWGQSAPGASLWNQQPAPPAATLWNQPAPAANLWDQPSPAANSWNQPAPADNMWGQPAQQAMPQRRQNVQEATLSAPGEQLLDYSKDILRYKPDAVRSAAAPSLQFASLATPGMEEPVAKPVAPRTSRPAAAASSFPAQWDIPQRRVRRSLPEAAKASAKASADAPPHRRTVRGLFDGGKKDHADQLNDQDWSAETERMRKKKQARQRQRELRDQGKDDRSGIQMLSEDGFFKEFMSSLLGKMVGIIGYLGNRLTRLTGGGGHQ